MKLTNDNIIKSTSTDQTQILDWILQLYVPEKKFDYDPTFSKGNFYKNRLVPAPRLRSCLTNETNLDFISDAAHIPLKSNSINSICFDPPFVMGSGPSVSLPCKGTNIIGARFGIFKNEIDLFSFYRKSLKEFYRVLKQDGILVFKCQDCVFSSKQILSHVLIVMFASRIGFYPKDIFILLSNNRLISGKVKNQVHARKYHSYFLVFIKQKSKLNYFQEYMRK